MSKQDTWLDGPEAARELAIRPERLAQMCRAGLCPYVISACGILIHRKHREAVAQLYPGLLEAFQAENEVDNTLENGELVLMELTCPDVSTLALLKCVERVEPTFPSRPCHVSNLPRRLYPRSLSPQ